MGGRFKSWNWYDPINLFTIQDCIFQSISCNSTHENSFFHHHHHHHLIDLYYRVKVLQHHKPRWRLQRLTCMECSCLDSKLRPANKCRFECCIQLLDCISVMAWDPQASSDRTSWSNNIFSSHARILVWTGSKISKLHSFQQSTRRPSPSPLDIFQVSKLSSFQRPHLIISMLMQLLVTQPIHGIKVVRSGSEIRII